MTGVTETDPPAEADPASEAGATEDQAGEDGQGGEELAPVPRRGRLALIAAGVLAIVVTGLVWVLATSDDSTDRKAYTPLLGEEAPAVAGESLLLVGEAFDLEGHRGQWVVVNFFATWCPPCIEEHPELISFDEAHGEIGDAVLVSVVFDDNLQEVRSFFDRHGGDWPVIPDTNGRISVDYGVIGVPETYLVDPEGVVRQKLIGGVTREGLERWIAAIEADLVSARLGLESP